MKCLNLNDKNFLIRTCMFLFLYLSLMTPLSLIMPVDAAATSTNTSTQDAGNITSTLCKAVNQLTGTIGRSIAILIVISLAIALFLGKVSWGIAIAVGVGMGILFGARDVVDLLSDGTTCNQ
jgi:type IV secretion system protein VirB2